MKYTHFLSFLKKEAKLNIEEEENIKKYFQFSKAKKKEIILRCGTVCDKIFFINKGIFRAFYISDQNIEITRMIATENKFLTNMISFRSLSENIENFECLEATEYLYISKANLKELLDTVPSFKERYLRILEEYNAIHINHIHCITNASTAQKVHYIKTISQNLISRISDGVLASFIGVSREAIVRNKSIRTSKV